MEKIERIVTEYRSEDGMVFRTPEECKKHEKRLEFNQQTIPIKNRTVYVSLPYRLSFRDIRIFSDPQDAERDALSTKGRDGLSTHTVEEISIDDAIWERIMNEQ